MASHNITNVITICWRNDIEVFLIDEIKKRKHLWDPKNPLYFKKSYKRAEYTDIANVLKARWPENSELFTCDELIRKFSNLRNYFFREFRKMKSLNSTSKETVFCPKWIHFNQLTFLQDAVSPDDNFLNDSLVSVTSSDPEVDSNSEAEVFNFKLEPSDSIHKVSSIQLEILPRATQDNNTSFQVSKISSNKALEKPPTEKKDNWCQTNHVQSVYQDPRNVTKKSNENTEDAYGMFIASQLQEIEDPMQRDLARIEIQNVLIKYKYKNS